MKKTEKNEALKSHKKKSISPRVQTGMAEDMKDAPLGSDRAYKQHCGQGGADGKEKYTWINVSPASVSRMLEGT